MLLQPTCEIICTVYEVREIRYWGVYFVLGEVADLSVDISTHEHSLVIDKVEVFRHRHFEVIQINAGRFGGGVVLLWNY